MKKNLIIVVMIGLQGLALGYVIGKYKPTGAAAMPEKVANASASLGQPENELEDILKLTDSIKQEPRLMGLGTRLARTAPASVSEVRQKLQSQPQLRQAFDKCAMPILSESNPQLVLEALKAGHWWKDQWRDEQRILNAFMKSGRKDLAVSYLEESQNIKRRWNVGSWLMRTRHNPAGLIARWLKGNDGNLSDLTRSIMTAWGDKDPNEFAAWLRDQNDQVKECGVASIVDTLLKSHPEDALGWAMTSGPGRARDANLQKVKKVYQTLDETARSSLNEACYKYAQSEAEAASTVGYLQSTIEQQ